MNLTCGEKDRRWLDLGCPLRLKLSRFPGEHVGHHVGLRAHLFEHRKRKRRIPEPDELVGLDDRQRSQDDGVDEREDRGHAAQAARQRKHCRDRQAWTLGELPPREADVVPEMFEDHGAAPGNARATARLRAMAR